MFRITFSTVKKETIAALAEKSENEGKSRSQVINEILEQYFEKEKLSNRKSP